MAYSETRIVIGGLVHVPVLIFIANFIKGKFVIKTEKAKDAVFHEEPVKIIEVKDTVVKERKAEVTSGKYGMVQILFNRQLQVFTMSPERFFEIYKSINSPFSSHKQNYTCGFGDTAGFTRQNQYDKEDFGPYVPDSNVHIYPSAWHNPMRTAVCITKDGSISYFRPNQNGRIRDQSTGQMVDYFLFCSKSNSTESTCKYNSNLENRYMITFDKFQKN